jgi:hypothetical protein
MPKQAVIIIPTEGESFNAFKDVAQKLKRDVYHGHATIVQTTLVPHDSGLYGVSFHTLDGHDFSWDTAHDISTVMTISHSFSGDGPNLAYHDPRFDLDTHKNQPWGSDPGHEGEMGAQGRAFWTSVATALRGDGKIILVGCFMGDGYAAKVAGMTGKRVYGSTTLFGAGNAATAIMYVRAIEGGHVLTPMKEFGGGR